MSTKFLLEDGLKLTKYKQAKLIENYNAKGVVSLPAGMYIKEIRGIGESPTETTTIIIIGKL